MLVTQNYTKDLSFWRPTTKRAKDDILWSSVAQIDGAVQISIPATSRAVQRTNGYAAYLRYPFYFTPIGIHPYAFSSITQPYGGSRTALIFNTQNIIITSDGNPSPPPTLGTGTSNLAVGNTIIAEGTINNGAAVQLQTTNYFSVPVSVGVFAQSIIGDLQSQSNTQNVWIVGGNSTLEGFSSPSSIILTQITNTSNVFSITASSITHTPILFPTCCIISSNRYLNRLFYTGGLSNWTTSSTSSSIFNTDTTSVTAATAPVNFTQAAAMSVPVSGVILIAGGLNNTLTDSQNTTYFYSPIADTWTAGPSLVTPRRLHQMVPLTNYLGTSANYVLIVGGKQGVFSISGQTGPDVHPIGAPTNKCEIINITASGVGVIPSGTFAATGSMSTSRYSFGMTTLPDGRILVCGGIGYNPTYPTSNANASETGFELNSCEIFDPNTGQWTPIQNMQNSHSYCVCAYVPGTNKVYVYGGYTSAKIEYLDLCTMQWHYSIYYMPDSIVGGTPIVTNNGFIALTGGGAYRNNTLTVNNGGSGSKWNQATINIPEYTRYDGLNAEWQISQYDAVHNILYLTSNSLGDYTNTNVRWSDPLLDTSSTTFTLKKAVASSVASSVNDIIGPFSLDNDQPFAVSGQNLILNKTVQKGSTTGTIKVTSGAFAVTPGYILFNYGYSTQVGPIKCFGATDDITLQIDPGFRFPITLTPGESINVLFQKGSLVPNNITGLFWLTASNAGRSTAIDLLQTISAAGIEVNITTRYPGDRGLGNEGDPISNTNKLSDIVECFGGDSLDAELTNLRTTK